MNSSYAVFCDDIRQETTGKFLLVGCYGAALVCSHFPYAGRIAALVHQFNAKPGSTFRAEYSLESGAVLAAIEIEVPAVDPMPAFLQAPLPPFDVVVSSADTLILKTATGDDQLEVVGRLNITQGTVPDIRAASTPAI